MTAAIEATPSKAPYPAPEYLLPTARESIEAACSQAASCTDLPCRIPVQVVLFFDGTNNTKGNPQ